MLGRGYWVVGRWLGAPIRLHFSILLGLLFFGHFEFRPGFFVGYPLLVLAHELGHAALVRHFGHRVVGVEVTGFGGVCEWDGNATPFEESAIAWGGVLAQALIYGAAWLWFFVAPPSTRFSFELWGTLTQQNLWLIVLNLAPIPPLDGARAWSIFAHWRERTPGNLPHGTWRDSSPNAQRVWFDRLRPPARVQEAQPEVEGPLSAEAQAALDQLLKNVTGKAKREQPKE